MGVRTNPWTNSRIILKNMESGETILATDIQESDYTTGWIWINESNFPLEVGEKVNALIISSQSLQECCCTVRNIMKGGRILLTVFKRISKEDERNQQRYAVNLPAIVRRITTDNQILPKTENVFIITILNMSSSGILFQTPKNQFDVNDNFVIETQLQNRFLTMTGKIVRIQNTQANGLNEECGAVIKKVKYI